MTAPSGSNLEDLLSLCWHHRDISARTGLAHALDGGRVRWLPRVVTVQFDRPGTALVVVQGRGASVWTVVEKRITVLAD